MAHPPVAAERIPARAGDGNFVWVRPELLSSGRPCDDQLDRYGTGLRRGLRASLAQASLVSLGDPQRSADPLRRSLRGPLPCTAHLPRKGEARRTACTPGWAKGIGACRVAAFLRAWVRYGDPFNAGPAAGARAV